MAWNVVLTLQSRDRRNGPVDMKYGTRMKDIQAASAVASALCMYDDDEGIGTDVIAITVTRVADE